MICAASMPMRTLTSQYVQVMGKAKFACERMALAKQQVGHLRSMHMDDEAAKAEHAASQHENTLKVHPGRLCLSESSISVKANNL